MVIAFVLGLELGLCVVLISVLYSNYSCKKVKCTIFAHQGQTMDNKDAI